MMPTRRQFLAGLTATSFAPQTGWAATGAPAYLAAAQFPDGTYRLAGLNGQGTVLFSRPLPDRGHAAAAHPHKPHAVAFARRPGTFAMVIDCASGRELARLRAPEGRHFYGHGLYSPDGHQFLTTENDYEAATGIIGIWDAKSYARVGEIPSGGIGPHDMHLMPDGNAMVVANGGIETHPDSGRTKLNLPWMQPNLTYLDLSGTILEQVHLPGRLHKNSIRHLDVRADGLVAFAMQWQGDMSEAPPLLGLHRIGQAPTLLSASRDQQVKLQGYAGSVAFASDGTTVAMTCPRGNVLHQFNITSGDLIHAFPLHDVCGLGAGPNGLAFTTGTGAFGSVKHGKARVEGTMDCKWDNHLIPIRAYG